MKIEEEDLARTARKHKTARVVAEKASKRYLLRHPSPWPIPWPRIKGIPRTVIKVAGDEYSVKSCVKDLLKMYGIPDEVPGGFLSGKEGKRMVESALRELGF